MNFPFLILVLALGGVLYLAIGCMVLVLMDGNGRFHAVMKRWSTNQEYLATLLWPLAAAYIYSKANRRGRPF